MKLIQKIAFVGVCLLFIGNLNAQTNPAVEPASMEAEADVFTASEEKSLKKELNLNKEQAKKFQAINKEYKAKIQAIKKENKAEAKRLREERKVAHKAMLTEMQQKKYDEVMARRQAKREAKKAEKKAAKKNNKG